MVLSSKSLVRENLGKMRGKNLGYNTKDLVKFLKFAHVPQETSADQFENCVASLTADNGLGFSDADLTPKGRKHNDALHVSIECRGTTLAHFWWIQVRR